MHYIHFHSQFIFIIYSILQMQYNLQSSPIIMWWVKPMVPISSFTFQIELGDFEELVFIQLSNFYNHLKSFCPILNVFHVFAPKELVHTFGLVTLSPKGFPKHTFNQYPNLLIQPLFLFPMIQQIANYYYLFICCSPYHLYYHISRRNNHID
jgi:hypothetical protein